MKFSTVHLTSNHQAWETPPRLFRLLDREFHFDLDAAATPNNAKCSKFISPEQDALALKWATHGTTIWCNPPYGDRSIDKWVRKALEAAHEGATTVMLMSVRTNTHCFHDLILPNTELRFIRGKLYFRHANHAAQPEQPRGIWPAPFPSMLAVFWPPGHSNIGKVFSFHASPAERGATRPIDTTTGRLGAILRHLEGAEGIDTPRAAL